MKKALLSLLFLPSLAFAQRTIETPETFADVVNIVVQMVEVLLYLIMGLSVLVFLWGVTKVWIISGGDAYEIQEGKKFVIAGIIGLFVMVSVWGIVRILTLTFLGQ